MILRVLGVMFGWWRLEDALDRDLFDDAADLLDRRSK
jgi:hypothetical protein